MSENVIKGYFFFSRVECVTGTSSGEPSLEVKYMNGTP